MIDVPQYVLTEIIYVEQFSRNICISSLMEKHILE